MSQQFDDALISFSFHYKQIKLTSDFKKISILHKSQNS